MNHLFSSPKKLKTDPEDRLPIITWPWQATPGTYRKDEEIWMQARFQGPQVEGKILLKPDPAHPEQSLAIIDLSSPHAFMQGPKGWHVHELPVKESCDEVGGHFNPFGKEHGGPRSGEAHLGDFGNLRFSWDRRRRQARSSHIRHLPLPPSLYPKLVNRAIVIHAGADDLGTGSCPSSSKDGCSKGRVACANLEFLLPPDSPIMANPPL